MLDELAGAEGRERRDRRNSPAARRSWRASTYGKYFLVDGAAKEDDGPDERPDRTPPACSAASKGLPDLCMVGLYAYNPPAILEAAKAKSMVGQVKIVGFDEDWETLKAIATGEIEATVVQDPFKYGYKSVEALAANARATSRSWRRSRSRTAS